MLRHFAVAAVLLTLCAIAFGGALSSGFVNFDDNIYVYDNAAVKQGLTADGLATVFTEPTGSIYQPLTMLSLMVDAQLWGLDPTGFHLTNLLLHLLCAWLLYWLLLGLTGSFWRSAAVAVLFAVHPLRVESVVWVTERKDVLSGVLFMLTLIAWRRYLRCPGVGRYAGVVILFGLGLLAKQTLVVLPVLLLLLDVWPLGRLRLSRQGGGGAASPTEPIGLGRLVGEKAILLALAAAAGVAALLNVSASGSAASFAQVGLGPRLANAAVSYARYMGMWIWPTDLAVMYPHPEAGLPAWQIAGALGLLGAITAAVIWQARARPYLLVGWLWYGLALFPVSGIAQAGSHALADRFTYLPQIGWTIALVWLLTDLSGRLLSPAARRALLAGLAVLATGSFTALSWNQTGFWRDSETLYKHALAAGVRHTFIYNNLGLALQAKGDLEGAGHSYRRAIELSPPDGKAHMNLGQVLAQLGQHDRAVALYRQSIQISPDLADAYGNLAISLYKLGQPAQAWRRVIECFERGGHPHPGFLKALSRAMPPPAEAQPWLAP